MSTVPAWWWVVFTLLAAGAQTARNAMQRSLTARLGTVGATHVRFLFGLPFALLSLVAIWILSGQAAFPRMSPGFLGWVMLGALSQIVATALMLAAMRERSFVVSIALIKTEPVQVAVFGLLFLGERLSALAVAAIVGATFGVLMMSWPKRGDTTPARSGGWRPVAYGVAAGAMFALSAVGFRGAIISLVDGGFVFRATFTLASGLLIQTCLLSAWLGLRERDRLIAIFNAWRPSLFAGFMGAFASQMWFLAFALETTAHVRTVALVELLFAQIVSRRLFAQGTTAREAIGIVLVVTGAGLLASGLA